MDMIMLSIVQGLEDVVADLQRQIQNTEEEDANSGIVDYRCGQRDAYQNVLDKLREICL